MQTASATDQLASALPFVGRRKEVSRLKQLHARRKHVLILGPAGVGKSALLAHLRGQLPLLLCPRSEHFGEICDSLEMELGLNAADLKLVQRKQRLRAALAGAGKTVVFDGLGWTTPKLSSFLESVMDRVPVWLCARTPHPWDIGHIWPLLFRFEKIELQPFHLSETRALIKACVEKGCLPSAALGVVDRLQHLAHGLPQILGGLIEGLASGRYHPEDPFEMKLLDLDRRIHELAPMATFAKANLMIKKMALPVRERKPPTLFARHPSAP